MLIGLKKMRSTPDVSPTEYPIPAPVLGEGVRTATSTRLELSGCTSRSRRFLRYRGVEAKLIMYIVDLLYNERPSEIVT